MGNYVNLATGDDNERAELDIDILRSNHALLNCQTEHAAAKHEQQAYTGTYGDYTHCLGMSHRIIQALWLVLDRYDCYLQRVLIYKWIALISANEQPIYSRYSRIVERRASQSARR